MGDINISEGIFARGWADTKRAMHTVWFWVLDAGGGALMGYFDPIWGIAWFLGGFAMLWIGATAGAPFKQRNEARLKLQSRENELLWVDMEAAARILRDEMVAAGLRMGVAELDKNAKNGRTDKPLVWAFRDHAHQGINDGIMRATGVPQFGSNRVEITNVSEDMNDYREAQETDPEFLSSNGVRYEQPRICRNSISKYVSYMKEHDAELKRRAKEE